MREIVGMEADPMTQTLRGDPASDDALATLLAGMQAYDLASPERGASILAEVRAMLTATVDAPGLAFNEEPQDFLRIQKAAVEAQTSDFNAR